MKFAKPTSYFIEMQMHNGAWTSFASYPTLERIKAFIGDPPTFAENMGASYVAIRRAQTDYSGGVWKEIVFSKE